MTTYLRGDVYYWEVTTSDGTTLDAVHGYYDQGEAAAEAASAAAWWADMATYHETTLEAAVTDARDIRHAMAAMHALQALHAQTAA